MNRILFIVIAFAGLCVVLRHPPILREILAFCLQQTSADQSNGVFERTDNSFDIAIDGEGYFQVVAPDGRTFFTRDGAFRLGASGELMTEAGYTIEPRILFPADTVSMAIAADGAVSAATTRSPDRPVVIGAVMLARFANPSALQPAACNTLRETWSSGAARLVRPGQGVGTLRSGCVEATTTSRAVFAAEKDATAPSIQWSGNLP